MGDIIWGTFITFTILLTLAVYRFRTRNKPHERNLARFVSILVLMGGLLGILTTGLNERLLRDHSLTYFLSLTFFILQTLASLLYYKRFKAIMALLILTLIMQMPLVYGGSFSYRNQTLFSLILQNGTKIWDVEPGSYISIQYAGFETNVKMSHNPKAIMGINLLPAFAVFVFLRERFFGQT